MGDAASGSGQDLVYRLRAVVGGISPLIWRRLLVRGETTIAGLHEILQTAFGWEDAHLHRFTIHGCEYGITYVGGPVFRDDARRVRLADLGLRETERFFYEYNFFAAWTLDLRLEAILPAYPGKMYPRCIGGRRAGPPEDWNGPWEFLERTQPHLVFEATLHAAEILGEIIGADENDTSLVYEHHDELREMLPLLGLERFDRRACNRALAGAPAASTPTTKESRI